MTEKLITLIQRSEDKAIGLGDMLTALRLDWLLNLLLSGTDNEDFVFSRYLSITIAGK